MSWYRNRLWVAMSLIGMIAAGEHTEAFLDAFEVCLQ